VRCIDGFEVGAIEQSDVVLVTVEHVPRSAQFFVVKLQDFLGQEDMHQWVALHQRVCGAFARQISPRDARGALLVRILVT
jgi:hypothetical protein